MGDGETVTKQSGGILANLSVGGSLALLAVLGVFLANQWHFTLLEVGRWAVKFPAVNRMGWNSATIIGLGRFLWLVIGGLWLFAIMLLPGYLREAARAQRLRILVLRLLLFIGVLFGLSYLLLKLV